MSENDIIAEYVKAKYPELLNGVDFFLYRLGKTAVAICKYFSETVLTLKDAIEEHLQESEEVNHE